MRSLDVFIDVVENLDKVVELFRVTVVSVVWLKAAIAGRRGGPIASRFRYPNGNKRKTDTSSAKPRVGKVPS